MAITLNEHDYALDMINSKTLGKKPSETLMRVARYYMDTVEGCTPKQARRMLDGFLISCNPVASLPKWSDTLDKAVKRATKRPAVLIDRLDITKPEMKTIGQLGGIYIERLAFTLLCLAKYWDVVNPNGGHWVNSRDAEIMAMANIKTFVKNQCGLYHTLNQEGLIRFSKRVDNTNVQVCFMEPGETELSVTDMRNLGYQYSMYRGGAYYRCNKCGIVERHKETGRPPKYCKSCAAKEKVRQSVESVMRLRGNDLSGPM